MYSVLVEVIVIVEIALVSVETSVSIEKSAGFKVAEVELRQSSTVLMVVEARISACLCAVADRCSLHGAKLVDAGSRYDCSWCTPGFPATRVRHDNTLSNFMSIRQCVAESRCQSTSW